MSAASAVALAVTALLLVVVSWRREHRAATAPDGGALTTAWSVAALVAGALALALTAGRLAAMAL